MKRQRNMGKAILSCFLAMMLVLQTMAFSVTAYADSEPSDSVAAVISETDSPSLDEPPSVTEAVYDMPNNSLAMTAAPTDKTVVFMDANVTFPLQVTQGTVVSPGGTIQGRQAFTLKSEGLKVPVKGDYANTPDENDTTKYIQQGDSIELRRDTYFNEVVLPTATKPLMATTDMGVKQLGTAYFTPDSIKIVFDGDDWFFNGVGRGVTFGFETTANSDITGMNYGDTKPITIFGGAYELVNPDVTAAYSITLSSPGMIRWDQYSYRGIQPAQLVEGAITWESTVSAFDQLDAAVQLPLDGKIFYTNPAKYNTGFGNVPGIYMEGSFKVNGQDVTPVVEADGSLTYLFPEGTGLNPKVEYKTWIPKEAYYYEYRNPPGNLGRSHRDMHGKVELRQDSTMLVQASQEISFAPDWIQASASYDHANETITWKVTVNQYNKKGLKDFTITNVLPAGLDFISAEWQTWVDNTTSGVQPITPDANSTYSFGEINGKVELVIKSKVTSGSSFRIDPRANWNLDTPSGIQNNDVKAGTRPNAVTDEAIVNIGAHTFTKTGAISTEDYSLGGVTWTVNLAPQYNLPDAVVYDVLVHGGDLNVLDNAVDVTGEVSTETIAKIKANVNSFQLWKQYHEGSLKTAAAGLATKAIPLTVDGKVVADLIKVTGYTDKAASFSFRSLETNPDILFRQNIESGKTIQNRALLFDGDTVKTADYSVNLHLRMLNKDMLFASKPLKTDGTLENVSPNNIGSYIRNDNNEAWTISAYDRTTKTVTFRLGVNMPGYNTEEMAKAGGNRVISNIKLVDTLPEGWEFVPFSEDEEFELWKGLSDNGSGTEYGVRNDARTRIEPGTSAHVVSFSHQGNEGTFTFSKLESPYVILVKARPSNTALQKYLDEYTTSGIDKQVMYNKADLYMTWGGVEKVLTEQRKVIVPVQTLGKSVTKPVPGVLEWTVNYTPPFNMAQGVYLQDTIGAGMDLRYEENGQLVLTAPSMAVYRAKLSASGALEREGEALDLSDPNSEVQVEAVPGANGTTVLTFNMDDPNQFYQFVYQTEVDPSKAKAGDKMGNEVKLMGDDKLKTVSARSESTLDNSDVAGSSSSNALLPLRKVDPDNNPLKGVEFTLYKKDSGTQVAKGTTDSSGKLNLLFPDPGYYELKETYIDTTTWLPTTKIYQVYVGNTPGKPIWVDGVKVTSDNPLVVPTPAQGKLTITNKVEGNGSDPAKDFEYTVTFDGEGKDGEYTYKKLNTIGTIKNGDKIILKHGESVTLSALPAGLVYTVTEANYTSVDGYTTNPETRELTGTIVNKGDHKADFVNERTVNKLTVSNTVMGNGGDKTKDFEYTVIFEGTGKDASYSYVKSDGSTGTIKSLDIFKLKHGETLDISDLPKGLKYTVTQKEYTADDYTTNPEEREHTGIMEGQDELAPFTNIRVLKGGLLISNTVKGKDDDKKNRFKYTLNFTGEGENEAYTYEKSDGSSGTIKNGETFELTDGQTLIVQGLPTYLEYKVTQDDYTEDGYVTNPESFDHAGTIPEKKLAEAHFINTRPYLEGVLRNNNTGEVIPNAPITIRDLKTGKEIQTETNEKGEYAIPATADTDYTITYTKWYQVGGKDVPVEFTQKANVDGSVTDETIPADITAVGIILFKQLDGTTELFSESLTSQMYIYLKDTDGKYVEENGHPKAFRMASNGTFSVEGLSEQKYTMEVRYKAETGEELLFKVTQLNVKANGELNISEALVDPYGTVYDETTGDATTGKKIEGAKVTLYYADTQRNRDNGRIPGTKVTLPPVPNFPPHDNESPEQMTDANGFYAYMVFPEADYYLIVTKDGYETHRSGTISVDFDIVKYDVPMKPIRSGGGTGGNAGNGNSGTGNSGNSGTDNGSNENNNNGSGETDNGGSETDNGGSETDNGSSETDNGSSETDNGGSETDNGSSETDNGGSETHNGSSETDSGSNETDNGGSETDNGSSETDNGNIGTDNNSNEGSNVGDELDDAPKTGDNSVSPMLYMVLALMSLVTIGLCLLGNKKKTHM